MPSVTIFPSQANSMQAHSLQAQAPGPQLTPITPMQSNILRRTGQRPLVCEAALVAHATGFDLETPFWFELNLFQGSAGGLICDIRLFRKASDQVDEFWVKAVDSLEEAADFFESFEPTRTLISGIDVDVDSLSVAEAILKSLELRRDIALTERQYKVLVGKFLYDLDNGGGTAQAS